MSPNSNVYIFSTKICRLSLIYSNISLILLLPEMKYFASAPGINQVIFQISKITFPLKNKLLRVSEVPCGEEYTGKRQGVGWRVASVLSLAGSLFGLVRLISSIRWSLRRGILGSRQGWRVAGGLSQARGSVMNMEIVSAHLHTSLLYPLYEEINHASSTLLNFLLQH